MADFAALSTAANYATLLTQISDRDRDLARGLDPAVVTPTNLPTSSTRWNSANKRWEIYNGTSWVELIAAATDAYNITVTGLRGGNLYGTVTNNGTISGGTIDATVLRRGGSDAWTAASLTNLSQLTNGPGFITASALSSYAPLAAPSFTGVPSAPTAGVDTNTTQLATTSFVINQSYLKAAAAASTYATLISPALTGTPTVPTATAGTNTTQAASTAFVSTAVSTAVANVVAGAPATLDTLNELAAALGDDPNFSATMASALASKAPLTGAGTSGTWGISITGSAPWSGITGKPTTLGGYGITDGVSITTMATALTPYALLAGAAFTGYASTSPSAIGASGTAFTLACTLSNVFSVTMSGNVPSGGWTITSPHDGQTINLFITQGASSAHTLGWPSAFKWSGSTPAISTTLSAVDLLVMTYRSATGFWYCSLMKNFA